VPGRKQLCRNLASFPPQYQKVSENSDWPASHMFFKSKEARARERETKRFYLLPGMGGRAYRRKRDLILMVSIAVGLLVSGLFALAMWLVYRNPK
jgi:hypothetical protein